MACTHVAEIQPEVAASSPAKAHQGGCEECVKAGMRWVHLRQCLICGHTGCCDSSVGKHATKHFKSSHHPVMRSVEPGEDWRWCYVDEDEV